MIHISLEIIHTLHIDNPPRQLVPFVTNSISEAKFPDIWFYSFFKQFLIMPSCTTHLSLDKFHLICSFKTF